MAKAAPKNMVPSGSRAAGAALLLLLLGALGLVVRTGRPAAAELVRLVDEPAAPPALLEKDLCWTCTKVHCLAGAHHGCGAQFADPAGADRHRCQCACCRLACAKADDTCRADASRPPSTTPLFAHVASLGAQSGFSALQGARALEIFELRGRTYALVLGFLSDAITLADLTEPASPRAVATAEHGRDGFRMLRGPTAVAIGSLNGAPHAFVTSLTGGGVQIVSLDNPARPQPVGALEDGQRTGPHTLSLGGAHSVVLATLGGKPHALVSAYAAGGLQLLDVQRPGAPFAAGPALALPRAQSLALLPVSADGRAHVLVTQYDGSSFALVDVTDPAEPQVVASAVDGAGGYAALGGAAGVAVFTVAGGAAGGSAAGGAASGESGGESGGGGLGAGVGSVFAAIASEFNAGTSAAGAAGGAVGGLQLVNVTAPREPVAARALVGGQPGGLKSLRSASAVAALAWHGANCSLLLVGSYTANGAVLLDVSAPDAPLALETLSDTPDGPRMRGLTDVRLALLGGVPHALLCASSDSVVHVYRLDADAACERGRALRG